MCRGGNKRELELKHNSNCVSFGSELNRRQRSVTHSKLKQKDMDKDTTEMF
jgi:hypothetical protein